MAMKAARRQGGAALLPWFVAAGLLGGLALALLRAPAANQRAQQAEQQLPCKPCDPCVRPCSLALCMDAATTNCGTIASIQLKPRSVLCPQPSCSGLLPELPKGSDEQIEMLVGELQNASVGAARVRPAVASAVCAVNWNDVACAACRLSSSTCVRRSRSRVSASLS